MKIGVLVTTVLSLLIGLPIASFAGSAGDLDNDTILDASDNCVLVSNVSQCDSDMDGYGNHCDGDFDNNTSTTSGDFGSIFIPDLTGGGVDSGSGTDMDCNTSVTSGDFGSLFIPNLTAIGGPGPSGLGCAGTVPCP